MISVTLVMPECTSHLIVSTGNLIGAFIYLIKIIKKGLIFMAECLS